MLAARVLARTMDLGVMVLPRSFPMLPAPLSGASVASAAWEADRRFTRRMTSNRPDQRTAPDKDGIPGLVADIRIEIEERGPIPFARFMELALYHPLHGYYLSPDRRPGRGGDFLTAPEMHPFFGLAIARHIAALWDRLDRPDPFTIREYGSGIGGLAYDIIAGVLDLRPELRPALRYRLNEINPHRSRQALDGMRQAGLGDLVSSERAAGPGSGIEPITGVVVANEVADALPVHRLLWTSAAFRELLVGWEAGQAGDGRFIAVEGPLSPEVAALNLPDYLARHGLDPASWPAGSRIEVSPAADRWIGEVGAGIARGYALMIDYGYAAAELYRDHRLDGTLRAYREHGVTDDPFDYVGMQDLTAHVDFSRLMEAAERSGFVMMGLTTQADFLAQVGLGDLLVALQQQPDTSVEEYYRAQAAVFRLIDPAGMGRFRVLGMARNAPATPPAPGFAGSDLPDPLCIP